MTHEKEINEEIQRDMAEIFEGFKKLIPCHLLETDCAANGDRYGGISHRPCHVPVPLAARALELYPERKRQNKKGTGEYDANLPRRKAYIKGWTDAQSSMSGDCPLADDNRLTDEEIDELRKELSKIKH